MANRGSEKSKMPRWLSIAVVVLAVLLALTLVLSLLTGGMKDWSKFKTEEKTENGVGGGAFVTPEQGNGVALTAALISPSEYEKYGISPLATETAYTVTATVTGSGLTAEQKKVTWSEAAFKVPDSGWAEGKSVSDYVTTKTNENQITVTCEKAFGAQIEITATSVYNSEKKASFTVDYKEKIEFTGLKLDSKAVTGTITEVLDITGDRTANVEGEFSHSDAYTIKGDTVTAVVKITRSSQLSSAVTSAFASRFPEYTVTVTSDKLTATISDFLDKEAHQSIFLNNYPSSFTAENMETVYNGLETMNTSSQAHYSIAATVTGAASNSSAQQKTLGDLKLSFTEIQTWYEAFTGFNISFDHENIIF